MESLSKDILDGIDHVTQYDDAGDYDLYTNGKRVKHVSPGDANWERVDEGIDGWKISEATAYWTTFERPAAAPASQPQTDDVVLETVEQIYDNGEVLSLYYEDGHHDAYTQGNPDYPVVVDAAKKAGFIVDSYLLLGRTVTRYTRPQTVTPATSEPAADVLDGVEKIIDFGDWCELYYRDHVVTVDGFENEPKFNAILSALEGQRWAKYHEVDTDVYFPRPQSPVASQPAVSETAGDNSLDGAGMTYSLETQLDTVKYDLQLAEEEISRLQAELADAREQLDAANRKLATIRHEEMEAIGDMVYGGQPADDEHKVYVEYEARFRQLDDHLYSADDVRRKMDDLEA